MVRSTQRTESKTLQTIEDCRDHGCGANPFLGGDGDCACVVHGRPRACDEKVESVMGDSQDGANRIQDPHWSKGASHAWGSLIPTICVNVWLRQSKPVIPA